MQNRARLMRRCLICQDAVSDLKTLYANYEMECIKSGESPSCKPRAFSELVLSLFPEVEMKRKRIGGEMKVQLAHGIGLKPLGPLIKAEEGYADFSALPYIIAENAKDFRVININDDMVECYMETEYLSNGNAVQKKIHFNADDTFKVFVGVKQVSLHSLGISEKYLPTSEGISEISEIVKKVRLCNGVTVTDEFIHLCPSRDVVEHWKNMITGKSTRQRRSIKCLRVLRFNSRTPFCTECYKTPKEALRGLPAPPPPITSIDRDDLKRMIPNGTEEMLELLLSQVENGGKPMTNRRWSKDVIATCGEIFKQSPRTYRMIRDHRLLFLPAPRNLSDYKRKIKQKVAVSSGDMVLSDV